jgi:hypothetical protein
MATSGSTFGGYYRLSRRQRGPSQPRRHQDTKKNTKESLREHLGALVSWWFNFGRVGLDNLQALPPAMTLRAAARGCRCPLQLPLSATTAAATAAVTEAVDAVNLHRRMLSGWVGGNPKSEIRNSKFEMGGRAAFLIPNS